MKPVKILFTIPNFDTAGSGKALLKIALRLDKKIFEPHIACLHNKGYFFKEVEKSGIPVHILNYYHSMGNRLTGFFKCLALIPFYRKFDLVHSFHYADDYSEPFACRMAGTPWIFVKKNMNWNSNAWKIRTRLANGIMAQNSDMQSLFFNNMEKVKLVPRGVDINEFFPTQKSDELLKKLGLNESNIVILTVANLVPVKGIQYLIQAVLKLYSENNQIRLLVVGDKESDYAKGLIQLVAENKAENYVIFTGKQSNIHEYHSIAKIFVLPTLNEGRQEGSPVSLLEAMASGTCVLASDVAGIRDQLATLPMQLFQPRNANEIYEKLKYIITLNNQNYDQLIKSQLDIIRNNYTLDIEVKRHEDFYKNILNF